MLTWKRAVIALPVLALLATAAIACGDDNDDAAAQGDTGGDVQKAQVMAAMIGYRAEGLHEIDDTAQEASEIDPAWKGRLTRMRQVTAGVDWPSEFAEPASTLESELQMTADAIDAEDLAGVKEHITLAHEAWHEFEEMAYGYIAGEEMEEGDHDEESASPSD